MQSIWRILRLAWPDKHLIVLSVIFNLLMVVSSIVSIPVLIPFLQMLLGQVDLPPDSPPKWAFDAATAQKWLYYYLGMQIKKRGAETTMLLMCALMTGIYFFKNLCRYLGLLFMVPVRSGIVGRLRCQMIEYVQKLSPGYFSEKRKGDIISRIMSDVLEIEASVPAMIEVLIREPIAILGGLAMMLYLSPTLTLYGFVGMGLTGLLIGQIGKHLRRNSQDTQNALGMLTAQVEETLSGVRIIQVFGAGGYQTNRYIQADMAYRRAYNRLFRRRDLASPLSEFLGVTVVVLLVWLGYREVLYSGLTPAGFIAFLYAFFTVIEPSKRISTAGYNLQRGLAALDRVEAILHAPIDIHDAYDAQPIQELKNSISFKNVGFAYDTEKEVLKNINFQIPKHKVVALVGASGAGKSTLADLLARFYDPTQGAIEIDGVPLTKLRLSDWRRMLGIVTQDAILFNDTIYNNIAFGWPEATPESVEQAARQAFAHEFILATEHGYQTVIGDRGAKLSGGQRQRLTIARALLRNPQILILDEATSALDSESERAVQEALSTLLQNRTALIIAHRLSTIQHADQIVVLHEGRLVEQGNHKQLLQQQGTYARLVHLQQL